MARWKAANWTRYHQLCVNLAEKGHTVHVLQTPPVHSEETNFREIEASIPPNLHLHDVSVNRSLWNARLPLKKLFTKGYYSWKSAAPVRKLIRDEKIDVLILYNIPQYLLLKTAECMTVFDIADDYPAMLAQELGKYNNPLVMAAGKKILADLIRKSDCVFCVANSLKETFPVALREKIHLLPNGVTMPADNWADEASRIRGSYSGPIVGFIGSFEYFIDFALILEAARRMPSYTFLLVGAGRQASAIQETIIRDRMRNVILTGAVPHQEINRYIGAMDICLNIFKPIPISHGACPIKLFEYLAMKKPVISTTLNEVKRIDDNFLLYADTADELITAIDGVANGRIDVRDRVERGYMTVRNRFEWGTLTDQLLAELSRIKKN